MTLAVTMTAAAARARVRAGAPWPTLLMIALAALLSSTACGPAGSPEGVVSGGTNARERDARAARVFDEREDEILRDLAAIDRRIAQRARVVPADEDLRRVAMAAVLREDPSVALIDGAVDPFSFDARARGLDVAKKKIGTLPEGAAPGERELLTRLVDAEFIRLDEERALPRSASSLIRAIVETWQSPKDAREAAEADRWLARRLKGLREVMLAPSTSGSGGTGTDRDPSLALDVVRARELDDALDALEHLASSPGFTHTTQELVLVRDALEAASSRPAAKAHSDWESIARRLRAHLGVTASADDLARDLANLEKTLRARADQAIATPGASTVSRDTLSTVLDKQVFVFGACLDAVPGSRVRSMAAPHEREPACHLRHLVARIEDDASRAIALAVMHDHVVVAEWALDVARGASTIAEAQGKHRLFVPVLPDTRARYERIALARPVAAIGAGEAVRILITSGGIDPKTRATSWSVVGDVPFDVAARELTTRPK